MDEVILYETRGEVAVLTLNRPDRANTLNFELIDALQATALRAANDPDVRVLIVTGAGRHFCGGADLRAFTTTPRPSVSAPGANISLDWVPKRADLDGIVRDALAWERRLGEGA